MTSTEYSSTQRGLLQVSASAEEKRNFYWPLRMWYGQIATSFVLIVAAFYFQVIVFLTWFITASFLVSFGVEEWLVELIDSIVRHTAPAVAGVKKLIDLFYFILFTHRFIETDRVTGGVRVVSHQLVDVFSAVSTGGRCEQMSVFDTCQTVLDMRVGVYSISRREMAVTSVTQYIGYQIT